jgi:hypothetical protein
VPEDAERTVSITSHYLLVRFDVDDGYGPYVDAIFEPHLLAMTAENVLREFFDPTAIPTIEVLIATSPDVPPRRDV